MAKWAISPAPSADVEPIDAEPQELDDGAKVQRFRTRFGKVFAKRTEATGLVKWFMQLQEE